MGNISAARSTCIVVTIALSVLTGGVSATAQSLSGVTIGSDKSALNQLGVAQTSSQALGPHTAVKFELPGGNELSATFLRSSGQIVYIETDWGGQGGGAYSDYEGFKYGETSLADIRSKLGHNGLMFDARPPVSLAADGSLIFFNSYEISGRKEVVTFVTAVAASGLAELQAAHGNEKIGDFIAPYAKLKAVMLADQEYADTIWGAKKTYDAGYGPINWSGDAPAVDVQKPPIDVSPGEYTVGDIFTGKTKLPDFKVRDAKWSCPIKTGQDQISV